MWGVIRVLDGRVRYKVFEPVCEAILEPGQPGLILLDQLLIVEPFGQCKYRTNYMTSTRT